MENRCGLRYHDAHYYCLSAAGGGGAEQWLEGSPRPRADVLRGATAEIPPVSVSLAVITDGTAGPSPDSHVLEAGRPRSGCGQAAPPDALLLGVQTPSSPCPRTAVLLCVCTLISSCR